MAFQTVFQLTEFGIHLILPTPRNELGRNFFCKKCGAIYARRFSVIYPQRWVAVQGVCMECLGQGHFIGGEHYETEHPSFRTSYEVLNEFEPISLLCYEFLYELAETKVNQPSLLAQDE